MSVSIEAPDDRVHRILAEQLSELTQSVKALRTGEAPNKRQAPTEEEEEEEERTAVTHLTGSMRQSAIDTSRVSSSRLKSLREEIDKNPITNVIEQVEAYEYEEENA